MTSLTDHQEFVEENPFDKVAALALVDRLQEEANGSRLDALKFVASLRKPQRNAEYLTRAGRVMRARTMAKIELNALIEDVAGLTSYSLYTVYLQRGFSPPTHSHDYPTDAEDGQGEAIVFVGARWVLLYYRQLIKIGRKHKPAGYPRDLKP